MKVRVAVAVLALSAGCLSFDDAWTQCHAPGYPCFDGGAAGGGSGGGAGGSGGGAPCDGCLNPVGLACVRRPFNTQLTRCGSGGAVCDDCTNTGTTCDPLTAACTSARWRLVYAEPNNAPFVGAWASGPGEAWFVSTAGIVAHVGPGAAVQASFVSATPGTSVCVVKDGGVGTVFVGSTYNGSPVVRVFDDRWDGGDNPGTRTALPASYGQVYGVFPAGDAVYAAGYDGTNGALWRYGAGIWTSQAPPTPMDRISAGWGAAADDFFLISSRGQQLVHVRAGGSAALSVAPATPYAIWGTGRDDVFVAGIGLFMRMFDGGVAMLDAGLPGTYWYGLWAADPSYVVLSGSDPGCRGRVVRYGPGGVDDQCLSQDGYIYSVHGSSPTDVWACDTDGGIWRYSP